MKRLLLSFLISLFAFSAWAGDTVDINRASAQEIAETLQGVGLTKAEEIVRYRDSHGDFQHADELVNVKGIGLNTVEKNRDRISVQAGEQEYDD
jgi:competence protein ComEA